ncbi:MAG: aminotransferase class V-fold PLP-dependent enzyme [Acidobacteria bacterium]|nr:aminotransferase class V-fold PLP-dependent enzyme [Acidobacteriota bacterium]
MRRIYLDHNATSPPLPEARAILQEVLAGGWANPASAHLEGRQARAFLDTAREQVARLARVPVKGIFFTSGGTEAAHAALHGAALAGRGKQVVFSGLEHAAVRAAVAALVERGFQPVEVAPDRSGVVDAQRFLSACLAGDTAVAALILAHNETGLVQPVEPVAAALGAREIPLVVDAVQAPGRLQPILPTGEHILGLLSAHKMGGLPGAGAVVAAADRPLVPFLGGGEQERRRRGGTPPLALIAAMGAAAAHLAGEGPEPREQMGKLRNKFEERLLHEAEGIEILGREMARLPNTCAFLVEGVLGEDVVAALDMDGVAVSSGSACSTGSARPSESLLAMGYDQDRARGLVRLSLGSETAEDEMDHARQVLVTALKRLRRYGTGNGGS